MSHGNEILRVKFLCLIFRISKFVPEERDTIMFTNTIFGFNYFRPQNILHIKPCIHNCLNYFFDQDYYLNKERSNKRYHQSSFQLKFYSVIFRMTDWEMNVIQFDHSRTIFISDKFLYFVCISTCRKMKITRNYVWLEVASFIPHSANYNIKKRRNNIDTGNPAVAWYNKSGRNSCFV